MQTVSLMVGPLVAILDEFCIWAETKGRSQAIYSAPSCLRLFVPREFDMILRACVYYNIGRLSITWKFYASD